MYGQKERRYRRKTGLFLGPNKETNPEGEIVNFISILENLTTGKESWVIDDNVIESEDSWLRLRSEYLSRKYWNRVSHKDQQPAPRSEFAERPRPQAARTGVRR